MASDKPVFLRPIEITATNDGINIEVGGGGANTRTIANGVYGCISTLLYEIMNTTLSADSIGCYLNSSFKVVLYHTSDTNFDINWSVDNTVLRDILGFTADLTGASEYTATYTPSHMWLPTTVPTDRNHFTQQHNKIIVGKNTDNGSFSGVGLGNQRYERPIEFAHELAINCSDQFATNGYHTARNYSTLVYQARASAPAIAGNPATKGFYFFPDHTDVTGAEGAENLNASMDSGGIEFDLASSPDTYVFCSLTNRVIVPLASLPKTRLRYAVGFAMMTSTAPSWNGTS
jgi:hypothetical protein